MTSLREIFAKNVKENRKKCGLTQEKLAEKADVSAHYIAMIELARSFPTSEVIERIVKALGIEVHKLFLAPHSLDEEFEDNRQALIDDIRLVIEEVVENAFVKRERKLKG